MVRVILLGIHILNNCVGRWLGKPRYRLAMFHERVFCDQFRGKLRLAIDNVNGLDHLFAHPFILCTLPGYIALH